MRILNRVTARGHGVWGRRYDIELTTHLVTRQDSTGLHAQTITSYDLLIDDPAVGGRRFESAAERAAFLQESFTDIVVSPLDPVDEREERHPLVDLIGDDLASVTFVRDYVQLSFDGPTISFHVWPRIHARGGVLERPDAGYAEALIGLIERRLVEVDELLDRGLVLDFEHDVRLVIPLDGTDLVGPEVAVYIDQQSGVAMVWRPGDEPIAWRTGTRTDIRGGE